MALFNSYSAAIDNYWLKYLQCSDQQISLPSNNRLVASTSTASSYTPSVSLIDHVSSHQLYPSHLYSNAASGSIFYNDVSSFSNNYSVPDNYIKEMSIEKDDRYSPCHEMQYSQRNEEQYSQRNAEQYSERNEEKYSQRNKEKYSQRNEEQYSDCNDGSKIVENNTKNVTSCGVNLKIFAEKFKARRMALGYKQADVGAALALYNNGYEFSQTTICRFENLQLSYGNACKLKLLLIIWMERTGYNSNQRSCNNKSRKTRTTINASVKERLEKLFYQEHKPSPFELSSISAAMNLEHEVVRVWFCNRRQKQKRFNNTMKNANTKTLIDRYNFNYQFQ